MKFKSFLAVILAELIAFAPILPISIPAAHAQATILPNGKSCFQATTGLSGMIGTIGAITPGSGYVNGSYGGVPLTGGSGTNGTANITVSGGVVSAVTILNPGVQFVVGDVLSAAAATIGGSGSGFSFPVASTSINSSLAGGSVAYYIPSTLTTKQTWQDAGETILNQNPVPLDANGCAIVYGSGTYRQILKDSLNDTVWDVVTASTGSGSSGGSSGGNVGDGLAVGTIGVWAGTIVPVNYLYAAGQAVSRTTYASLMTAITYQQNISCQLGIATITVPTTVSDGTPIGAPIEASCFAPGTTVSSKISGQLTLSTNATATVSTTSVIFPWGDGDGATSFNLLDLRGRVIAGADNMNASIAGVLTGTYYTTPGGTGVNPDALNAIGGSQSWVTTLAQVPGGITSSGLNNISVAFAGKSLAYTVAGNTISPIQVTNSGTGAIWAATSGSSSWSSVGTSDSTSNPITVTSTNTGGAAHTSIQPTLTAYYIIKALPDTNISVSTCSQLTNSGTACTANTGTSGHTVPFLDGTNIWSGGNTFSNIAITGGSITGLPNPVNASDAATKAYVDAAAIGIITLPVSGLATAAVLPNTPTYNNGASGVGATLTAGSNTTLTVDGTVAALNTVILVKNQAAPAQNGIYTVTTAGGGVPWVLTRATYFNAPSNMLAGSFTLISGGATNVNTSWALQATVTSVGTSAANFNQFGASSVTSFGGAVGAITLGNGLQMSGNTLSAGPFAQVNPANVGNYAIAPTDCNTTVAMGNGSSAQFTVTLPSSLAGFPALCTIFVKNVNIYTGTNTGHAMTLSQFPSDLYTLLWPQQTVGVQVNHAVAAWQTIYNPGRWVTPLGVNFHVDNTNGANTNDGLGTTTAAVKDPQQAAVYAYYHVDTQGSGPVISLACSQTHTVQLGVGGTLFGTNLLTVSPDGNCAATWTNAGPCISIADLAEINLNLTASGSSGTINFQCNQSNSTATGNILLHNDVVVDLEGTPVWTPAGVNDNFLFCDGMCQFNIVNGINQAGAGSANYVINMSAGGHGTSSGTINASASGGATGVYYLFGGAILAIGTATGTGWSSISTSKVYGHATVVTNGITPDGGYAIGTSGVACTSLTTAC